MRKVWFELAQIQFISTGNLVLEINQIRVTDETFTCILFTFTLFSFEGIGTRADIFLKMKENNNNKFLENNILFWGTIDFHLTLKN